MTIKSFANGAAPIGLVVVLLFALQSSVLAQGYGKGTGDATFSVGFGNLAGVDNNKHISFGASVGATSGRAAILGEYNFLPQGSITQSGVKGAENIQQFGAALRLSLTAPSRFTPYAVIAGGYDRITATASAQGISVSASQSGAYFDVGGGASIFLSPHWGIRPECRWERQQFAAASVDGLAVPGGGLNDVRGTVGLFFAWGGTSGRKK